VRFSFRSGLPSSSYLLLPYSTLFRSASCRFAQVSGCSSSSHSLAAVAQRPKSFPNMIRKKLIAGNWKMNKGSTDAAVLAKVIINEVGRETNVDIVVCPPFTALDSVGHALDGSSIKLGAQNMHPEASG